MLIWKPNNNKRRHNVVITKNNDKIWTSAKPNKIYIIRKVLMRAIKKWIWATVSNLTTIFVKFWLFLQWPLTKYGYVTWPKMQISNSFYFVLILHLIFGKVTMFAVKKLSTSEAISKNLTGRVENKPPPPPPVLLGLSKGCLPTVKPIIRDFYRYVKYHL